LRDKALFLGDCALLHLFEFNGARIALDVNSGTVHLLDEVAWELLSDYGRLSEEDLIGKYGTKYGTGQIMEALAEIRELKEKGLLFAPDPGYEGYDAPGGAVKALCLNLAHSCNLRCRYCFAGGGRFGGNDELMPAETGRKAVDFLIARSGGRRRLEIDFFGGEPLLNFQALKEVVGYGLTRGREEGKEFSFTVTTNAVLLDRDVICYLKENGISVVLSLDGRREIHDAMRPFPGGRGSYDAVLSGIRSYMDSRCASPPQPGASYSYIRGTYTRRNLEFCADVLHLAGLGFKDISLEPVIAPAEADYSIREGDLPLLFAQYERLALELLRRRKEGEPLNFFHFNIDLDGGPCLPKRLSGCGAGHEYMAVAPNGDLYPCHQFVGREGYLMGNIRDGFVDENIVALFRRAHVYNKEGCPGCWAKFYCSGGCHANAEMYNGSILKPQGWGCELIKKRLECAIYLKAAEHQGKSV